MRTDLLQQAANGVRSCEHPRGPGKPQNPSSATKENILEGSIPRILIADNKYLIGLEAERIIQEARICRVTICRSDQLTEMLAQSRFDLVFVDAAITAQERAQQAHIIRSARADLVFIHTGQLSNTEEHSDMEPIIAFEKPFNEGALGAFIKEFRVSETSNA
jgi:hypothetical protein